MGKSNSGRYHPRRMEREMPSRADQHGVLRRQKYLTLALCNANIPYLVTLNYGFSEEENSFYCHCALDGRKLDFVRANPLVWGQVVEDLGYVPEKCTHAYRSVMFEGRAEILEDAATKRRAIELMIDSLDPNPAPLKARLTEDALARTVILRIQVLEMTGKQSPPQGR
jgi:uncharacterized protein